MHVQWNRRQLRSNRQLREVLCPHDEVDRPWLTAPVLIHYEAGRFLPIWYPGPTIRECCLADAKHSGFALAAWWWEVDQRFSDLKLTGLADQDVADQLVRQLPTIGNLLRERVPRPSEAHRQIYLEYREEAGLTQRRLKRAYVPLCFERLGLSWPCTKEDLLRRWQELAKKHHPDRGGVVEAFTSYNLAYREALGRLERRAAARP